MLTYPRRVNIQRTSRHLPRPAPPKIKCAHDGHAHAQKSPLPYIREAYVDVPHAVIELAADHVDPHLIGAANGAVSALSLARGIQNFQAGGLVHNIEGVGNVALAASSGIGAYQAFLGDHHEHGHHHGLSLTGGLEMVHGAAEIAIGGIEVKEEGRTAIGLARIVKGGSVLAAQLIPGAGPISGLVHLGAVLTVTALDPKH